MGKFIKKKYRLIIFFILIFIASVSVWNAWDESAIYDETAHIGAGYSYLTKQDMRLNPEHPPLIKDLAAAPLLFLNLNFDTQKDFWEKDINGQWDAGKDLLYNFGNNAHQIIFFSRLPIIVIALILGLFIFKWTREFSGIYGGLLALVLFAFDPNILGHNHFVTTDIGIAAFITFSFYYFLKFIKEPTWKNVFWAGIFLGLVQLSKFSAIMILPVFVLTVLVYCSVLIKKDKRLSLWKFRLMKLGEYLGKGLIIFGVATILIWGIYALNTAQMPSSKLAESINYYFSSQPNFLNDNQIEILTNKVLIHLSENNLTKPLSEYLLGVAMVFKRVAGGNSVYYMGQVSSDAFPSYFPVVFLIKEPLPTLFLYAVAFIFSLSLALATFGKSIRVSLLKLGETIARYLRTNIQSFSMLVFIILYAYVSLTGNLNLGIRHLFPIFPFAFILTAKAITTLIKKSHDKKLDTILNVSLFSLLFLLIAGTLSAFPYYLSYFNEVGGGPKKGFAFVTDSNADWGQDLKRLERFLEKHPEIKNLKLDYFGGGDPKYYLGDNFVSWWDSKRPTEEGWYAISVNFLQGSLYDKNKTENDSYVWLKNISPKYQVGTSILIYEITKSDLK